MQRVGNIVCQSSAVCAASSDADTRDGDEVLTKPWNQLQQDKRLMFCDKVHCQYVLYCSVFYLFLCPHWWLADEATARLGCPSVFPSVPVCVIKFISTAAYTPLVGILWKLQLSVSVNDEIVTFWSHHRTCHWRHTDKRFTIEDHLVWPFFAGH